jgi:hypothetical protein
MPFSIIFQLYRGGQFYWYEETGVPGENHLKQLENMYMKTNDTNYKKKPEQIHFNLYDNILT